MNEIDQLQTEILQQIAKLNALRKAAPPTPVANYTFQTLEGTVRLLDLFGDKTKLFAIHNMGQACRYCTLWADGLNGFLPHLESEFAVVLMSKDPPATQRAFANARGWRYRLVSHGGGDYSQQQSVLAEHDNMPGLVCYERRGDEIFKLNAAIFGPGDLFCSLWHILALAGVSAEDWTPQYAYWRRPQKLEDGGLKVLD